VTALLRRQGHEVNFKRVQRVRRKEGLQVRRRQRKLRRLGISTAERQRALHANHVWSWDFVEDQTENGTRVRVLTLIDEYTRECLAVHVDWSIRAVDVRCGPVSELNRLRQLEERTNRLKKLLADLSVDKQIL
jgi:transposase InsO family protein